MHKNDLLLKKNFRFETTRSPKDFRNASSRGNFPSDSTLLLMRASGTASAKTAFFKAVPWFINRHDGVAVGASAMQPIDLGSNRRDGAVVRASAL